MKEIILNVEGMHCGGCERRIQNAVKNIEGVENVIANHNDGTVKITLNKEIEKSVIAEVIEDIGFEVKED